jgi:hypothetical protein
VEINNKIQSVEKLQCQRISEARVSQAAVVTELVEYKQNVENSLSMFQNELIEIRKGMTAENLYVISEKLVAAGRDSSSKLGKLDDTIYILEEKVAAAARTVVLPLADNQNNGTQVSVQAKLSSSRTEKDGSQHSVGRSESEHDRSHVDRVDVFPSQYNARNVCKNEINGRVAGQGTSQCLNNSFQRPMFAKVY